MRVVIVGPGAIGCLVAGFLADADIPVHLLDKDAQRAQAISRDGILIESETGGSRRVRIPILSDPRPLGVVDVLCLCVKAFDTTAAIQHARPLVGPATAVVTLQNGLGNAERIAAFVKPDQIVCAVTGHGSTYLGVGHIRHAGKGSTLVASWTPAGRKQAEAFSSLLTQSGMNATLVDDPARMIWSKLIINAAINPVTALWNVPNGAVWTRTDLRAVALGAATEARDIAAKKGISDLFQNGVEAEIEKVCQLTAQNFSSMLQDIQNGRRTEIDAINGAIAREARVLGITAPANEKLHQRILALEYARRKKQNA